MAFRTSPQLGPDLETVIDSGQPIGSAGPDARITPQVGVMEPGSDSHLYIRVMNNTASQLAVNSRINISDDGLYTVTTNATGTYIGPNAVVPVGSGFWAKKFAQA